MEVAQGHVQWRAALLAMLILRILPPQCYYLCSIYCKYVLFFN
jgi:hypothetical protein